MPSCSLIKYKVIFQFVVFFLFVLKGTAGTLPVEKDSISPFVYYKHFGEEEGLTGKTVYSAMQDVDGFMWFGTNEGAFRFDGKNFRRFTRQDGITDNEVFSIFRDSQGRIWFLTFNGYLSYWKDGVIHNSRNTPFLKNAYAGSSILASFEDRNGRIWFGTQQSGFIVIKNDSSAVIKFPDENLILRSAVIVEDLKGDIWSFNTNRMYKVLAHDFKDSISLPSGTSPYRISRTKNASELYYSSREGIFKMSNLSAVLYIKKELLPPFEKIISINADGDYLWVCTSGSGCYEYVNGKMNKKYFEKDIINSCFKDREGNLWFTTMTNGVFMIPSNRTVVNYSKSSGLSGDKIISIAVDGNNTLWLGYNNGVIDEISNFKKTIYHLSETTDPDFLRVLNIIPDSAITWFGTDGGVYYIENAKLNFIPFERSEEGNHHYSVKRLVKMSDNSLYATYSFNLLKILKDKSGFYIHQEFDSISRTFSIAEYARGHYIISGMHGLMEYIPGEKYSPFKTKINFSDIRVIDIKTDSDQVTLLATTDNGLYILKDENLLQHFTSSNGLSDDNCNGIYMVQNVCYLSTSNGLNVLKKKNGRYELFQVLTTANGLLSNSVNDVAVQGKEIYIATDKGLTIYTQTLSPAPVYSDRVTVISVITDTIQPLNQNSYSFSSAIPRLLIRFAYPVFNPVNQAKVKYRLIQNEKDDLEWITSGNNEIEFSSLRPGFYTVELKPDLSNVKNADVTRILVEIKPLWWQTLGAKAVFFLGILGLIIFVVRRNVIARYKRQMKQQAMLEDERTRIASDMHDDIGSDLTQMHIWSNILIKSKGQNPEVAEKISKSSDDVLEKMDQIIWALNSVHDSSEDLITYLHEYASQYLEAGGISLLFEMNESAPSIKIGAILRRNIFLILKELLNNTVKHSKAKNVTLKIFCSSAVLKIYYSDDGVGYNETDIRQGMGFSTIRERLKELNARFTSSSKKGEGVLMQIEIGLDEMFKQNGGKS